MQASTTEPESPVPAPPRRRARRWLRIGAGIVALWALADLVLWLVTPSPGTFLLEEPAGSYVPMGLGVSNGQPILVRFADKDYHQPMSVRRLVDGVALPVAVSPPAWEREPVGDHPFAVTDGRLTVLEPSVLYDRESGELLSDGGRDCITQMPLDGGPTVRRCHSPSLRILAFHAPVSADGTLYYAGTLLRKGEEPESVALASVSADGTWRELDRVNDYPAGNGIAQDSEAIYWATRSTVRRVSRKDGSARIVFHSDLNPHPYASIQLVMLGQALIVTAFQKPRKRDWLLPVNTYAIDPNGETRASAAKPIVDFGTHLPVSDGLNAYFVGDRCIMRMGPDGRTKVLAQLEDDASIQDLTLTADRVIYLARNIDDEPNTLKLWSVPK